MHTYIFKIEEALDGERIDKALEIMKDKTREEILEKYCPHDTILRLPNMDGNTWDASVPGCRGISCEECWNVDVEEKFVRTDWRDATEQEIAEMTFDEAKAILQKQINLGHKKGDFKPRAHMTRAMEIVLEMAEKYVGGNNEKN